MLNSQNKPTQPQRASSATSSRLRNAIDQSQKYGTGENGSSNKTESAQKRPQTAQPKPAEDNVDGTLGNQEGLTQDDGEEMDGKKVKLEMLLSLCFLLDACRVNANVRCWQLITTAITTRYIESISG